MKERPILFSDAMVRAILDGRKTQTRRVFFIRGADGKKHAITSQNEEIVEIGGTFHYLSTAAMSGPYPCPYGQPGDRLWVREAFMHLDNRDGGRHIKYRAGGPDFVFRVGFGDDDWRGDLKWTPSIHMRREYSRILIEITKVRVERLQDINEQDAEKEGAEPIGAINKGPFRVGFYVLWDRINEARGYGWDKNPWVWVIEFRRIEP